MTDLIGNRLGPYEVVAELGRGGMAVVYRAFQPSLDRYVALKVLPPSLAIDPVFVQRFLREAKAAACLNHPNIVTIHDVGEANGFYYIVMEQLAGRSLSELIRREGKLSLAQTIFILTQVASALDYAHRQGIVHRDIKPGNIVVGPGDRATLTDFGIAKAIEGTSVTQSGVLVGTPQYMAPEQIKGELVGPPADLYSLGIVLFEMLTGQTPFNADTPTAVLYQQVHEPPPPVRAIAPSLPWQVDEVLSQALAKDPMRRFRSAGAMVNALQAAAFGRLAESQPLPPTTTGPAPFPPMKKPVSRPLWAIGGLTIVTILIMLVALLSNQAPVDPRLSPTMDPGVALVTDAPTATPAAPVPPSAAAQPEPDRDRPIVTSGQVINVYRQPAGDSTVLGKISPSEKKTVVGRTANGEWWQVCCVGGEPGWVMALLVTVGGFTESVPAIPMISSPSPSPSSTPTDTTAAPTPQRPLLITIHDGVNIRTGPGISYEPIGQVRRNASYAITGVSPDRKWWEVNYGGRVGWISASMVEVVGSVDQVTVSTPRATLPAPEAYAFIALTRVANSTTGDGYENPPIGRVTLGGVPFDMPAGVNSVTTQAEPLPGYPTQIVLQTGVSQPEQVHLLITAGNLFARYQDALIGVVRLEFTNGRQQSYELVAGQNIREWKIDGGQTVMTSSRSQQVYSTISRHGGTGIIDILSIPVAADLQAGTLDRIVVEDWSQQTVGSLDPAINLLGVTVQSRRISGKVAQVPSPQPALCAMAVGPTFARVWNYNMTGCPTKSEADVLSAYETFERGFMVWRQDDDGHYAVYDDRTYDVFYYSPAEPPNFSCPEAEQLGKPRRGFGIVWCQNPTVRHRIGQALDDEVGDYRPVQIFERGFMIYLKERGVTYAFLSDGTWRQLD